MEIRPYKPAYRDACLALFDSNSPVYFAGHERRLFESFLDQPAGPYYVADHDGEIIACGGFAPEADGQVSLTWGIVHARFHKQGLGRFLLMYRLREITKMADVEWVRLETIPAVTGFFEKQGFRVMSVEPEGYGPGIDRVRMAKRLRVCT